VDEEVSEKEFTQLVTAILSDAPRPGAPAKFSPEQVVGIRAIACEKLDEEDESSRPVSHWTPREVRDEAINRGLADDISVRTVGRWLKGGLCSPIASSTG
jgi:putative transposase